MTNRRLQLWGMAGILLCLASARAVPHPWQIPQARILPHGDLAWTPAAFTFHPGDSIRYIDFEGGDDSRDGRDRQTAWKHHPWDAQATGQARDCRGIHTYVFKRGSLYRGSLQVAESGTRDRPIRLTVDPDWGTGSAVLSGGERITGWTQGAVHRDIPEADKVWFADLDFAPRTLWQVTEDGTITRIPLARTPNWTVTNYDDIKSEWWQWENPKNPWGLRTQLNGRAYHLGVDETHLTEDPAYYQGAMLWTEYGWVMGTPYPTRVRRFDPKERSLTFGGQWGGGAGSYHVPRHARYYLEDKPHYLDDPDGEYWFDKRGAGGRLYLRCPDGTAPSGIEAGRHRTLIDAETMNHVHISGLTFRFSNTWWDLDAPPMRNKDVDPACIRLLGKGDDIVIAHCVFEYVHQPIRIKALDEVGSVGRVVIRDNILRYTDHGGMSLNDGGAWGAEFPKARLYDVKILRNKLSFVGRRPTLFGQGHAIEATCPELAEIAGNVLDHTYGAGIFVFGGKRSGARTDRPLTRILIHHNKVTHSLLNNNDWGGIETWQGGPAYIFDNISGNPGGFKMWGTKLHGRKPCTARFGHAYYMDGGYKQYYFNNIAWGKSNDPYGPLGNTAAFQEIHGFFASVFNNTVYNFVNGSRRQAPQAGRNKYLGNIWQDIGYMVFRHADPKDVMADPNQADAGAKASDYEHESNAYAGNLVSGAPEKFAVFEPSGRWHRNLDSFKQALAARGSIGEVGEMRDNALLRDADGHDFRPTAAAQDHGVKLFVPWGLYATVAEWPFIHAGKDPSRIMDEHFHLAPNYVKRDAYHKQPLFPLKAVNIGAEDYVEGPLEDWTRGALKLNGRDQYAVLESKALHPAPRAPAGSKVKNKESDWVRIEAPEVMKPGERYEVSLILKNPDPNMKLRADLHWGKTNGEFGGTNCWGGDAKTIRGEGPYVFRFKAADKPDLGSFTVTAWLTPSGDWGDQTAMAYHKIPRAAAPPAVAFRSPDVADSNFLLEVCFKTDPGAPGGILMEKRDGTGYALTLQKDGRPQFTVNTAGLAGTKALNDGKWHHVIAEAERRAGTLTLYVDGTVDATGPGPAPGSSLSNGADLVVGGSPRGRCLAGTFEFARIAHGTLADAKTDIETLFAWQFDGPFLQDWNGRKPADGKRDAGAIEGQTP